MAKSEIREGAATIRRAVLSVSDKTGLVELARALAASGVELIASGGTRSAIAAAGLDVVEVADYTGHPEMLDGRVKTLHPRIHGGILARRDDPEHMKALESADMRPIDLVVVNLYPFEKTVARPDCAFEEAVENIDIGGPSLIRAASKNHDSVAVLTDPAQYAGFLDEFQATGGTDLATRKRLARQAFALCAGYDRAIAAYLEAQEAGDAGADDGEAFPKTLDLRFALRRTLRYGENPHQAAALYVDPAAAGPNLTTARILHGKELSYNNLLDLDAALRFIRLFDEPAACILKHNNPCGAAVAAAAAAAFEAAYEGDPVSAFGGIVGLNRPVDAAAAAAMCQPGRFLEAILAPGFDDDALELLKTKPSWRNSVRLVALGEPIGPASPSPSGWDLRRIEGGLLAQGWDEQEDDPTGGRIATKRPPTAEELKDLALAWKVCALVKSNAIVVVKGGRLLGVGAGQMSRLDSVRIAVSKAGEAARGAVLASDAFFPFRDGPDVAAAAGVTAIIQPGGSKRDAETVDACDEHGMAMVLTGRRHFRH